MPMNLPRTPASPRAALLLLAACAVGAAYGCERPAPEPPRSTLRVAGGQLSKTLADAYQRALPHLDVQVVEESGGATGAAESIQRGEADIGVAFADLVYFARGSQAQRPGESANDLRAISALHVAPLFLLVRSDSGITSVADLRGRRVRTRAPAGVANPSPRFSTPWRVPLGLEEGSGTIVEIEALPEVLLAAFGVGPADYRIEGGLQPEIFNRLVDGTLDAAFATVGDSDENIRAAAKRGARLVSIEGEPIERLRREYSFLRPMSIPAHTYTGQETPLHTIGVRLLLICRSDLDEGLVHDLTRLYFDALPTLASVQERLKEIDPNESPATPIPLHDGAARYYREQELFR